MDKSTVQHSFFSLLLTFFKEGGLRREIKQIPRYEYFLWLIYKDQVTESTYVPLSNRVLKKIIRQEMITRIKNNLFRMGLIQCDFKKRFITNQGKTVGTKSYSYRITPKYYIPHNAITHTHTDINAATYNGYAFSEEKMNEKRQQLEEKIKKKLRSRWDDLVTLPQMPEYQFIQRNALRLEMLPEVYSWIDSQVENKLKLRPARHEFINQYGSLVVYTKHDRVLTPELAEQWKAKAERIEQGIYWFNCSAKVNRVYYSLTALPRELRRFLRYNGEPLMYLDFSNFQPFLFIKQLREQYADPLPADVLRYIELTSQGQFYNEMRGLIERKGIAVTDKDKFKVDFFARVFFSSEKKKWRYRTVFKEYFPNVSAAITQAKANSYKDLSIGLQRLEAQIVINTVLREVTKSNPDCFVLPLHDALVCAPDQVDYLKELMLSSAQEVIGLKPRIKAEPLNSGEDNINKKDSVNIRP